MADLVFGTRNNTATGVAWHKGRRGGIQASGGAPGICEALTITWLEKSLAAGPAGITDRVQLGRQHLIAIIQGAYDMGSMSGTDVAGYAAKEQAVLTERGFAMISFQHGDYSQSLTLSGLLSNTHEHSFFCIKNHQGHAMGTRIHDGGYDFFDPNVGLIRCETRVEFRTLVTTILDNDYKDQLGGEWVIAEVG